MKKYLYEFFFETIPQLWRGLGALIALALTMALILAAPTILFILFADWFI